MPTKYIDTKGHRFFRLVLTGEFFINKRNVRMMECVCDCGKVKFYNIYNLNNGKVVSCGCFRSENASKVHTTHGLNKHPLYGIWCGMKGRCQRKKCSDYKYYGGIGVKVCKEWDKNFMAFYNWALSNGWEKGLELDKDKLAPTQSGKLYSPKTCCFLTPKENKRHTRKNKLVEYNGQTRPLGDWCDELNMDRRLVTERLNYDKWDVEKAFHQPKRVW